MGKCCKGRDGKYKEIYETVQAAYDRAMYIEETRGTYLDVYRCPCNNGFHLTSNNATSGIIDRQSIILQKNNIPLSSANGSWEFIKDAVTENTNEEVIIKKKKINHDMPIIKTECKSDKSKLELSGKVANIDNKINIQKIFNFNSGELIPELEGNINQITLLMENHDNKIYSYTILIRRKLLKKHKIEIGSKINITVIGKSYNRVTKWFCEKIEENKEDNNA